MGARGMGGMSGVMDGNANMVYAIISAIIKSRFDTSRNLRSSATEAQGTRLLKTFFNFISPS